ncbi:hypothetical protein HIM_02493 [Hirsutella minnesotensis 3608]|nr:hypothetical protein HIM_02493 [Hirsutella minnesotensis 3608]
MPLHPDHDGSGSETDDGHDSPTSPPDRINLLTINCWGLLHISTLREPRLAQIGRHIASLDPPPHIVCLQECWVKSDYRAIRRATRRILPHAKFYHAGVWGAGLAILSRWPIEESSMVRYPLNGRPTAFWRGDWYVGKGIACATLRVGPGQHDVVHVFNTHTHAPYEKEPNDSYICHRTAQAWEMAKLLRAAAANGHLVVALGDFNMLPLSLAHRIMTARAPVRDVWRVLYPDSSLGPAHHPAELARGRPVPTAEFNLLENGATSDGLYNTWRWTKNSQNKLRAGQPCPVDPNAEDPRGKRLDYIFASAGSASSGRGWIVESAAVALTERHPDLHVSLSDHFAVQATLRLHTLGASGKGGAANADNQLRYFQDHDTSLPLSVYDEILSMTRSYTAREHKQQRWRGVHFFVSVVVWIGCLVAVWFSPRNFVSFLLMLLASLGLTAGVVDGLLALLFFSAEIRGLREFKWEVLNARRAAAAAPAVSHYPPSSTEADGSTAEDVDKR